MPTLDVRNEDIGQNILINYSSAAPVSADAKTKILAAVKYARQITTSATNALNAPVANWSAPLKAAFQHHMRCDADGPDMANALLRVKRNLGLVHAGIAQPFSLSDARSGPISTFCDTFREEAERYSGKTYDAHDNGQMIADLIADDGWGDDISFFGKARKYYLKTRLQMWDLGGTFAGNAGGSVKITSAGGLYSTVRETDKFINNDYTWQLAETDQDDIPNKPGQKVVSKVGTIHLAFSAFENHSLPVSSKLFHACLIIHEASHKFALTADFAYADNAGGTLYDAMTLKKAVNNADSLAYLCICAHKNLLIKEATDIKTPD